MSEKQQGPMLDTDFDGTAVKKFPQYDPHNWSKWPLPMRSGYDDFLDGFESNGGQIGKILTIRKGPRYLTRRTATRSTIKRKSGLTRHFTNESIVFAGNEERKAQEVIERAETAKNGYAFIDDNPHKIGAEILRQFSSSAEKFAGRIVLGAVQTEGQDKRVKRLTEAAFGIEGIESMRSKDLLGEGIGFSIGEADLIIVSLGDYTKENGAAFARQVKDFQ